MQNVTCLYSPAAAGCGGVWRGVAGCGGVWRVGEAYHLSAHDWDGTRAALTDHTPNTPPNLPEIKLLLKVD
jgi:hypothetical protein